MGDPQDFDSQLYMCTEAFDYMDLETVSRLCESGLLLAYSAGILIYCVSTVRVFLSNASVVAENSETEKFFKRLHERDLETSDMDAEKILYDQYEELENRMKTIEQDIENIPNMTLEEEGDITHAGGRDGTSPHPLAGQVVQGRPDLVFYAGMQDCLLFFVLF